MIFFYPLDQDRMDATYVFRHAEIDLPKDQTHRIPAARIARRRLDRRKALSMRYDGEAPIYFDSATQIDMPQWHKGRVALIGDACGCLTLLAGQGSHMAMAGGYVLAQELVRHGDPAAGLCRLSSFPQTACRPQAARIAARFANLFVPSRNSWPAVRRAGSSSYCSAGRC